MNKKINNRVAISICILGLIVNLVNIVFFISLIPYIAFYFVARRLNNLAATLGGGLSVLLLDSLVHIQIFLFPGSSTDAIGLMFLPFALLLIVLPFGFVIGWTIGSSYEILSERKRKIIRLTFIALAGFVVIMATLKFDHIKGMVNPDAKVGEPRIILSNNQISKKNVYSTDARINGLQYGNFIKPQGNEIAVIGHCWMVFLDSTNFNVLEKKKYPFHEDADKRHYGFGMAPYLLNVDEDEEFEVLNQGGGYGQTGVLDDNGSLIWEVKRGQADLYLYKLIAGDLDRDGEHEFYGHDGHELMRLDSQGNIVWTQKGDFSDIDKAHISPSGEGVLVVSDRESFNILKPDGSLLRKIKVLLPGNFNLVKWSGKNSVVANFINQVKIFNFNGEEISSNANMPELAYHGPHSVAVKFKKDADSYLAVTTDSSSTIGKSLLRIFSHDGQVIYKEVLNRGSALATALDESSGLERLLVSEVGTGVWAYEFIENGHLN